MTLGFCTCMTRKKNQNLGDINRNREGRMMNAMGGKGTKRVTLDVSVFSCFAHCETSWVW